MRFYPSALFLALLFHIPLSANELNTGDVTLFSDSFFKEKMESYRIPGAVFTVVRDGRVIFSRGYGFQALDKKTPVDPARTAFRLCSVTKTFTATGIMQYYERGRIDLKADIRSSGLRFPRLFDEPLTLSHLLTHTGGFDETLQGLTASSKAAVRPPCDVVQRDLPGQVTPPGRYYRYSNHGLVLAGCLLERAAGKPWASVVKEDILIPLGMERTYIDKDEVPPADLARPYAYAAGQHAALGDVFVNAAPAGSLFSTGDDMARYLAAHLNSGRAPGPALLKETNLRLMHSTQFRMHPDVAGAAFGFYEDIRGGMRNLEHAGDLNGYAALLYLIPDKSVGFFVAYNLNPELRLREELIRGFMGRYFPPASELSRPTGGALSDDEASRVTGTYRLTRYSHRTWEKVLGNVFLLDFKRDTAGSFLLNLAVGLTDPQHYAFVKRDSKGLLFREIGGEGTLSVQDPTRNPGAEQGRTMIVGKYLIPAALEKLRWYELPVFQAVVSVISTLAMLSILITWIVRAIQRRLKHTQAAVEEQRLDRLLTACAALYLVFYVLFAVVLIMNQEAIVGDIRLQMYPVLMIPNIAFIALLVHIYRLGRGWIAQIGSTRFRILHSTGAGCLLLFSGFLFYWNLLGFWI